MRDVFLPHVYETTDFSFQSTVCEAISLLVQGETTIKAANGKIMKARQEND